MHADFGSGLYEGGPIGIPYVTVSAKQRGCRCLRLRRRVRPRPATRSRANAPIEGGRAADGDRHVIVVDRDRCRLYELYAAYPQDGGRRWHAGSGAIWNLRSNRLRPRGLDVGRRRRPADPARPRALRGGAPRRDRPRAALHRAADPARRTSTRRATTPRARATPTLPPMGQRLRLKASFDISGFPPPGARRAQRAQALRDDPRRQRLAVVHHRRARPRLGQRRPPRRSAGSAAATSRWSIRPLYRALLANS